MKFLLSNFVYDVRTYSWDTAFYNARFLIGTGIMHALIRKPYRLHIHDECHGF